MANSTFALYLTAALSKLEPPTDWCAIEEWVLTYLKCSPRRHKYYAKQLYKALEVGLRFGIINELDGKYYLTEYAKFGAGGRLTYEFKENPLSLWLKRGDSVEEEDENMLESSSEDETLNGNENPCQVLSSDSEDDFEIKMESLLPTCKMTMKEKACQVPSSDSEDDFEIKMESLLPICKMTMKEKACQMPSSDSEDDFGTDRKPILTTRKMDKIYQAPSKMLGRKRSSNC